MVVVLGDTACRHGGRLQPEDVSKNRKILQGKMDTSGHKGGCVQKSKNIIGENGHIFMDTREEGWTVTTKKDVSKNEKIL